MQEVSGRDSAIGDGRRSLGGDMLRTEGGADALQ